MKTWVKIILVVVAILVAVRLALPVALKSYVNSELGKMKDYTGAVADVDVALLTSEYALDNLVLEKRGGEVPEPLLQIERVELGIDWDALLSAELVADIYALNPVLSFVDGPTEATSQLGGGPDWIARLNAIVPFQVNAFTAENGTVKLFRTEDSSGTDEISEISQISVEANNFTNTREENDEVFATFELSGMVQDTAPLKISAELDPIADPPEITLDASLVELPLTRLNALLRSYASIDAHAGNVEIYLEFASADGRFDGYVKPLIEDADILRLDEEGTFFGKVWEGVVEFAKNIFENQKTDQIAAEVPLTGKLTAVDAELIPAVFSILRNAFIEALSAGLGDKISLENVQAEGGKDAAASQAEDDDAE